MNKLLKFYEDCIRFNDIGGKSKQCSWQDMRNQQKILQSEVTELTDGLNAEDQKETLDGILDVLVVAFGQLAKLREAGYDVDTAMQRVADNNLSKFIRGFDNPAVKATVEKYKQEDVAATYDTIYDCWVVKRSTDDKILKPVGFVDVDISDCLPEEPRVC